MQIMLVRKYNVSACRSFLIHKEVVDCVLIPRARYYFHGTVLKRKQT